MLRRLPIAPGHQLHCETLDSWFTSDNQYVTVAHYDKPVIDAATWRLQIGGLVQRPLTSALDDLQARPRQEVTFTLECSGNHRLPFLTGAVSNATWAGTPLAPVLEGAGLLGRGSQVAWPEAWLVLAANASPRRPQTSRRTWQP